MGSIAGYSEGVVKSEVRRQKSAGAGSEIGQAPRAKMAHFESRKVKPSGGLQILCEKNHEFPIRQLTLFFASTRFVHLT